MKKIILIILYIILFYTFKLEDCECQTGWIQQQSGSNYEIRSIYFLDSLHGFLITCSYPGIDTSQIIYTSNGGTNWITKSNYYKIRFNNITFSDCSTGFICADSGCFLKTTNGGINWTIYNIGIIESINKMKFFNKDTGIAITKNKIFLTHNTGENWIQINVFLQYPSDTYLKDLDFINKSTVYVVSGYFYFGTLGGDIYKTTNGGYNWDIIYHYNNSLATVSFKDSLYGIAMGYNSGCCYTFNGGLNWISNPQSERSISQCKYFKSNKILAVGGNEVGAVVLRSTDGGQNWTNLLSVTGGEGYYFFLSQFFLNENLGWVAGRYGKIYKTYTGGVGISRLNNIIPNKFLLFENYPNPFNATTKIRFAIKEEGKGKREKTKLVIYDILGKEVQVLVNEELSPGMYEMTFDGTNLASGIYFYQLSIDNVQFATKKMVILK